MGAALKSVSKVNVDILAQPTVNIAINPVKHNFIIEEFIILISLTPPLVAILKIDLFDKNVTDYWVTLIND
jgi:hypothetical protein